VRIDPLEVKEEISPTNFKFRREKETSPFHASSLRAGRDVQYGLFYGEKTLSVLKALTERHLLEPPCGSERKLESEKVA
jgi:hypothetical protein